MTFNWLIVFPVPQLVWRLQILSTLASSRGRNLRNHYTKYEEAREEEKLRSQRDDFSDMVAEVDLLRGQKTDRVDVSLQPEELDLVENVLPAKYEEACEEEKLCSQREDFSDMVAENEKKRKRKQEKDSKSKKKDFKF